MKNLRRLIPSTCELVAFEAAARLQSFTAAGQELGMSQTAVSLAIKRLEDQLGFKLFVRGHRRVELTQRGCLFFTDVSIGLSHIQKSILRHSEPTDCRKVTLSASVAFTSLWMAPRLQRFYEDLPDVELCIHTSDRDVDLASEGMSLGIRRGDEADWPQYDLTMIAPEEIYPICSTAYIDCFGTPDTVESLLAHRLIHFSNPNKTACTWLEWLKAGGVKVVSPLSGLTINDYVSVIQSVVEGQGIALGWAHLTDRLVASGSLVRLTDFSFHTGKSFHVALPKKQSHSRHIDAVRDWLVNQRMVLSQDIRCEPVRLRSA